MSKTILTKKNKQKSTEKGIALFMVMSTLAVLSILVSELTYSTQVASRMAFNYIDNLKAYYLAKSGYKISLLRLKAFAQVNKIKRGQNNKAISQTLNSALTDKLWSMPFIFPIPIQDNLTKTEKDKITDFLKESKLSGSYIATITSESSKINLNNILVQKAPVKSNSQNIDNDKKQEDDSNAKQERDIDFRKTLEPFITSLIEQKKDSDKDFADSHQAVQGRDVVDAIYAYLLKDMPVSNLPGFKPILPKLSPFYSLSELKLIPGMTDTLYDLLKGSFTVYSTPGININTISKETLHSLIPEMTEADLDDLLKKRDDPDYGKPWDTEDAFWEAVNQTSANRYLEQIKDRLYTSNIAIITQELSFKILVQAKHGLSTRQLEAYVSIASEDQLKNDPNSNKNKEKNAQNANSNNPNGRTEDSISEKKLTGLNLIYWRMM